MVGSKRLYKKLIAMTDFDLLILKFLTGNDGLKEWKKLSNSDKEKFFKHVSEHKTLNSKSKEIILWATT